MSSRSRSGVGVMVAVALVAALAGCSGSSTPGQSSGGAASTASSAGCADVTALKASLAALTQVKPLQDGVPALQAAIANVKTSLDAAQASASAALQPEVATVKSAFDGVQTSVDGLSADNLTAEGAVDRRGADPARHRSVRAGLDADAELPGELAKPPPRVRTQTLLHPTERTIAMTEDRPLLDTLADMTAASVARADLADRELMLVRVAGLIAVDAPPASYLINLGPAVDSGLTLEDAQSVLVTLAPIVGGPRVVDAAANIASRARARPGDRGRPGRRRRLSEIQHQHLAGTQRVRRASTASMATHLARAVRACPPPAARPRSVKGCTQASAIRKGRS